MDARINPGRIPEHADRERLLLAHPAVDVAVGDLLGRQQVAEELPVVDLGGSGRNLVGNLPAQRHKRPLPGRDMMVLGVGDHPVKIEENGTWGHENRARELRIGTEIRSHALSSFPAAPSNH